MAATGLNTTTVQDAIAEMVRRIVSQFNPEKIILFGSHARGQAGPDSDVDLLIVMPVEGSKRRKATEIDGALADRRIPLDLLVVTPEEFDRARHQVGSVLRPAALEGLILYDRAA
ncbi:MAG TPA: nucleotidyltransferase domain-containing protein [Nitrospiraceae bacterium]|jgi:predicted nucleotidyltransferase|nr:nucleotidyltransferase domain-containing protein [Nitrospiraceae bacterium]